MRSRSSLMHEVRDPPLQRGTANGSELPWLRRRTGQVFRLQIGVRNLLSQHQGRPVDGNCVLCLSVVAHRGTRAFRLQLQRAPATSGRECDIGP
jgi:hypothetical protein